MSHPCHVELAFPVGIWSRSKLVWTSTGAQDKFRDLETKKIKVYDLDDKASQVCGPLMYFTPAIILKAMFLLKVLFKENYKLFN